MVTLKFSFMIKLHEVLHICNFCIYSFLGWQITSIKQINLKSMGSCYYGGKVLLIVWVELSSKQNISAGETLDSNTEYCNSFLLT